jgi:carbon-monoxide dehydrogenase large subunit
MKPDEPRITGQAQSWIGLALPRREDDALVAGRGCYVDDLSPAGCVHLVFVRSPWPRARILSVRLDEAQAMAGVLGVFTGEDLAAVPSLAVNQIHPGMHVPPHPILARNGVNAVGEPVVAVVAESLEAARDAAELVEIEYDAQEPVLDHGAHGDALFAEVPANEAYVRHWKSGDTDAAFAGADVVVRTQMRQPRVSAAPMEPRAVLASWDAGPGELTVWVGTQSPHRARIDIARGLALPEAQVRVIVPDVGGAFGSKASLYVEDICVAWAARRLRRPVKWTAMRGEDLMAATHGRGIDAEAELAVRRDGTLLGLRARVRCALGHWMPFSGAVPGWNAARILPGPYLLNTIDIGLRGSLSNAAGVGIYRGAGRPEAALLMERLMDEAARELGIDPLELRRRNVIPAERFPYTTATEQVLDSGNYGRILEAAAQLAGYAQLREEQARRRAAGELFGVGISLYVEPCGFGWESARVRIEPDGSVTAATGSSDQGQGHKTAFGQIAAQILGVPMHAVRLRDGDTRHAPPGVGALASRSIAIGGSALAKAAQEVRDRGVALAAQLLGVSSEEVVGAEGGFAVAGRPGTTVGWAALAALASAEQDKAGALPLEADVVLHSDGEAWSYGCCIAAVSIDADTGELRTEKLAWVDDAGLIINPLLAEGQLRGGLAQGIGQALMEAIIYDENGQLLTGSFMDYAIPRADDIPDVAIEKMSTPAVTNPLGAKGVGESGTIAVPPALLNAALDALAPRGVRHLEMPLTRETLWRAMNGSTDSTGEKT